MFSACFLLCILAVSGMQIEDLEQRILTLEAENREQAKLIADLQARTDASVARPAGSVAFLVGVDGTLVSNGRVLYDVVVTDVGDGWRAALSQFTCPQSGTYVFSVSTVSSTDQRADVVMYKGGLPVITAPAAGSGGARAAASNTAVVSCQANESVYVSCRPGVQCRIEGSDGGDAVNMSTFSGYLLADQ